MTARATARADELRARGLAARCRGLAGRELLAVMIERVFPGRIALVSSFGSEAAVLLHMVSGIDPATPVIFLDTGKLFGETLAYRERLVARLGLREVRSVSPDAADLDAHDPNGVLWRRHADQCCLVRKVLPLRRALGGLEAWINGRKGYQGELRSGLPLIEAADGRVKINPLAGWRKRDIDAYFERHDLPRHPLEADGFLSIGCMPCTDRVAAHEGHRAGRWRGIDKNECGIHLPPPAAARLGRAGAAASPKE